MQRDYTRVELDDYMVSFAEVDGTEWILVSYVPIDVVYADLYDVRNVTVLVGVLSILVLAILIGRVVHVTIKPVKELTKAITAMTDGDFTVSVTVRSNDELVS